MAEAEAEARAMAEEARLQQLPPPPPPELVAQLLASVAVLLAPPSGQAVADANGWLMRLACDIRQRTEPQPKQLELDNIGN